MKKPQYSPEFRAQAVLKAKARGDRTIQDVATDLNVPLPTLKWWLKVAERQASQGSDSPMTNSLPASNYTPAQRLGALLASHHLSGEELHAWCRGKGLFEHQLKAWHAAICAPTPPDTDAKMALRDLQRKNAALQSDLNRKDKALSEAAALLVLQKKFRLLLGEEAL
jgi:transposase-like protein